MVRNGQAGIAALPYRAGVGVPPGVEVLDFPGLLARAAGHGTDPYTPRRPEFHVLVAVRSGTLRCSLDFTDHELGPGGWLWARPGQVYRYNSTLDDVEGRIVLFLPGFLDRATAEAAGIDRGSWPPAEHETLWQLLELLHHEYTRWDSEPQLEVLRHLLAALVLKLAGPGDAPTTAGDAFLRFQQAVEQDFARTHRVEDYAVRLGYSVRTLTRATQAAVGHGAKRFIDNRVLLEAKRLLVHTNQPAASVGQRVGFPGATAFTKFFHQRTGQTPTEFRARSA